MKDKQIKDINIILINIIIILSTIIIFGIVITLSINNKPHYNSNGKSIAEQINFV